MTPSLVDRCELPNDERPEVAKYRAIIGNGVPSLIWYMDVPPSTNVFLGTPPLTCDKAGIYPFLDPLFNGAMPSRPWRNPRQSHFIAFDTTKLQNKPTPSIGSPVDFAYKLSRDDAGLIFCAAVFPMFISRAPSVEHMGPHGAPTKALALLSEFFHNSSHVTILSPNFQRLGAGSTLSTSSSRC